MPSGDLGPLDPCVRRINLHKLQMSKTLLTVALGAFFLGVCLCSACVCCMWCISSRITYSVEDGFSTAFDSASLQERWQQLRDIAGGRRDHGASIATARDERSLRVEMMRQRYNRLPLDDTDDIEHRSSQPRSKRTRRHQSANSTAQSTACVNDAPERTDV